MPTGPAIPPNRLFGIIKQSIKVVIFCFTYLHTFNYINLFDLSELQSDRTNYSEVIQRFQNKNVRYGRHPSRCYADVATRRFMTNRRVSVSNRLQNNMCLEVEVCLHI